MRSELHRRGTQHPKRHYGRATTCRFDAAGRIARDDDRVVVVELVELLDARHRRDLLERHAARFGFHRRRDGRRRGERVRRNLHHAAAVVRRQQEFLAALAVDDHVEHAVAGAELGDRHAAHLLPWLQVADRELHERRAGVPGKQILLAVERVGHERVDGRARLHRPVVAVVDLDARAAHRCSRTDTESHAASTRTLHWTGRPPRDGHPQTPCR